MKIIQSFAQFDEGSYYMKNEKKGSDTTYLNFYSMLLSVLTLQKYYGKVTMYCNQKAHDSFIKYLPYNEIKIVENKNPFHYWSYYKVDIIKRQRAKFIHVDPDVFIFDDLFSEFMKTEKFDVIIQDTIPKNLNPIRGEMNEIRKYLESIDDIHYKYCDSRAVSNGVVGMTHDIKKKFTSMCEVLKKGFDSGKMNVNPDVVGMIAEELALYLVVLHEKSNCYEILPYDEVLKDGSRETENKHKFTHMWGNTKFNPQYIEVMKLKTIKEFPLYADLIERYESEVMDNIMV